MNAPSPTTRIIKLRMPHVAREFELIETENMTLLAAIGQIRSALPQTLRDAFVCHAGACNTCSILIDGKPGLACTTFTRELGPEITVAPGDHAQGWEELRDDGRKVHG